MNIHITKEEFDYLSHLPNSIGKFTIGSKLYGLNDENSDDDFLTILYPFFNKQNSPFDNHHQFQYKDINNNIDYNFVDIVTFIKNLLSGDSPINYELLYSEEFKQSELGWLSEYTPYFKTYTIIRSYLGMCDRDLRHFKKRIGRDKVSGMLHIMRGFKAAKSILNDSFSLDNSELLTIKNDPRCIIEFEKNLNNKREEIKNFRHNILTIAFQNKEIPRYLEVDVQREINWKLMKMLKDKEQPILKDSLFTKILNCNENLEMKYD